MNLKTALYNEHIELSAGGKITAAFWASRPVEFSGTEEECDAYYASLPANAQRWEWRGDDAGNKLDY